MAFGLDKRAKTAPSHYPRVVFHTLRTAQLVSSIIVAAIMCFFIYHLTHDHWSTPWTFVVLSVVSLLTVAILSFTIVLHCCIGLQPRLNIFLNSIISAIWLMGFSMLTWFMSGTLTHYCDMTHWDGEVGIMVCRIYKALFAFSLLGFVSTFSALILDFFVYRKAHRRGTFNKLQDIDVKKQPTTGTARAPLVDDANRDSIDEPRYSETFKAPRSFSDRPKQGAKGYNVPEEQFGYDTEYRGHQGDQALGI